MRKSGILLHIASLPNPYGIGTMGKEAYDFVDYLVSAGQKIWQILPLSQTSYGDSPYQSFSIYAGNPYFISMEVLEQEGLLTNDEYADIVWREDERYIDYSTIYNNIFKVFKKAYDRFILSADKATADSFKEYKKANPWLKEYALFMALKNAHDGESWDKWETPLRIREKSAIAEARKEYAEEIDFWCFLQYKFIEQWRKLKAYANGNGIEIIGDIPIYTAYDSADVWCQPDLFLLDEDLLPTVVAGFPPDAFSPDGQLWGNPIYNWEKMKSQDYSWWVSRMAYAKSLYDIVRIDHFIGFNSFYAIPYGDKTAANGEWREGPKYDLFRTIKRETGKGGIIAEDLGIITSAVRKLLNQAAYPGMKVLQFAFSPDGASEYLPQNYTSNNCVVYTSTHDNDTTAGWVSTLDKKSLKFCKKYLGVKKSEIPAAFIELAWKSSADIAMTTIQDLHGYGSEARINIPSTVGTNWRWRATSGDFSKEKAEMLKELSRLSNRNDIPEEEKSEKKHKKHKKIKHSK